MALRNMYLVPSVMTRARAKTNGAVETHWIMEMIVCGLYNNLLEGWCSVV